MIVISTKDKWLYPISCFLIFAALAAVNTQMIPFMKEIGYSSLERSIILAGNALIAIIGQFLFGYLCDRFHAIRPFFLGGYLLFVAASFLMFIYEERLFWYHLFAISGSGGLVKVLMGLNETWMLEADAKHYGWLRACGALGLSVGSPIAGWIAVHASYRILLYGYLALSAIICGIVFACRDVDKQASAHLGKDIRKLLSNRGYLLLVLIYLLIYMAGTADQYAVVDKLLEIGGNASDVGLKWGLQSFAEVPVFLFGGWLLQKVKPIRLLLIGILLYAVKFTLYAFFQEPAAIVWCALLQLVTMPIILLTSKLLIRDVSEESVASSAQMFAMAVFVGVSALITPLVSEALTKWLGQDGALYVIAGFCLLPFALVFLYRRMTKQRS